MYATNPQYYSYHITVITVITATLYIAKLETLLQRHIWLIKLGDTHAHVPHAMNKCNCKTNLEINEPGYMAVKLFMCYCSCIAVQIYNW